ncbi:MAG: alpha-amylase family glycosyl hydrolase [Bacteroidales bacterium]|nr:alpha-amylase family glycosyl hydrolase [Bacteroidales bacterium]
MKKYLLIIPLLLLATSCARESAGDVVYEMNVRQYTPEGTFAAAQNELPRLKELGVDIVWLMPIYEIGQKGRKGTLGSYYAIKDYKTTNPEFGTLDDFDAFVAEAHRLGLRVILDWVANHTSPDAAWVTEKPADWYYRDSLGNTIVEYDWTDIAKLNYGNADMRSAMQDAMRFWVDRDIDGFRCDMAMLVPQDFWTETIMMLRKESGRPLFFLAEGEETWLHEAGFDATYAWKLHHMLNDIANGKAGVEELKAYIEADAAEYPAGARRLMFTSNHDENSWAGTEMERMGKAASLMAVLTFTLPNSQPLIYTGQEVGYDHRLAFFEKDPVPSWYPNMYTGFYRQMTRLRHSHSALRDGSYEVLDDQWVPDDVFAFTMTDSREQVLVLANFSQSYRSCTLPDGVKWADAFTGDYFDDEMNCPVVEPWGWRILVRK